MASKPASDLAAAVGQLLIMGFDGTGLSPRLRRLLSRLQPGGVILFARNITSAEQTYELLQACRGAVRVPMFLCVDMEGGTVDRFRHLLGPAPAASQVGASGNRKLFRKHGRIIGRAVRALGFNTDFAPVVDLGFEASRRALAGRTVSADPGQTIVYAREFLRGLRQAGVLGCGKHFPGLGEATLDSHKAMPVVRKSWPRLWAEDLVPYRVLRRQVPFVIVSHAAFPAVTRQKVPASLSRRWVTDILREKIGYRGLIATDDLEMGGALVNCSIAEAAVEAVRAGCDIFLVCRNEDHVQRCYEAVVREAGRDPNFAARVKESARRILAFKKKLPELKRRAPAPGQAKVDQLARALWELGEQVRLETISREEAS